MKAMITKRISELDNLSSISKVVSSNPEWKAYVISKTPFLTNTKKFAERIYCVVNDIHSHPLCHCGNKLKFRHWTKGYLETCSYKCYRKIHPTPKQIEAIKRKQEKQKIKEERKRKKEETKQNKELVDWISKKKKELRSLGSIVVSAQNNLKTKWIFKCTVCLEEYKRLPQNEIKSIQRTGSSACEKCRIKLTYEGVGTSKQEVEKLIKSSNMILISNLKKITKNTDRYNFRCTCCNKEFSRSLEWIKKTASSECTACLKRNNKLLDYDFVKSEIEKDGNKLLSDKYIGKKKGKRTKLKIQCHKCNEVYEQSWFVYRTRKIKQCPTCAISDVRKENGSSFEKDLELFIKNLGVECITSEKTIINPKEIDIYIPSVKLGIEVNGNYWHSEHRGKDKNYHIDKTIKCKEKDIQLLHFYEDELIEKMPIIKSMIRSKLKLIKKRIFARKCSIRDVTSKEANKFFENNHIQGKCNSSINKALIFDDKIVSIASFSKSRFSKSYDYELIRFATKLNTIVVGGFSKLLKSFDKKGVLVSYADRRYSVGNVYEENGFKLSHITRPGYYYTKGGIRFNRQMFQKHKLENKLESFDKNLTEYENMIKNNYSRIWDCGQLVFTKEI